MSEIAGTGEPEKRFGSADGPPIAPAPRPPLTIIEGGRPFRYNQTTGLRVDERKLAISSLVRNFRIGDIHAVVTVRAGGNYRNEQVSGQATTGTDVVVGLVNHMLPKMDTSQLREETRQHERTYLEQHIDGAHFMDQDIHRTDLMVGLEAFREVMANYHGPTYYDACEHFRNFGAYLVIQASM